MRAPGTPQQLTIGPVECLLLDIECQWRGEMGGGGVKNTGGRGRKQVGPGGIEVFSRVKTSELMYMCLVV
jgi:hypothetical protein